MLKMNLTKILKNLDTIGEDKYLLEDVMIFVHISLHCDFQTNIKNALNSVYNSKKKFIRLKHAIVKHMLKNTLISIEYMSFIMNLANCLIKQLIIKLFLNLQDNRTKIHISYEFVVYS